MKKMINLASKSKNAAPTVILVGEIEMNLSQILSDGSGVYRPEQSAGKPFEIVIGEITVKPGFLPKDVDFNRSFIEAETDDPSIKKKQKEFAKFLKLKIKIEM